MGKEGKGDGLALVGVREIASRMKRSRTSIYSRVRMRGIEAYVSNKERLYFTEFQVAVIRMDTSHFKSVLRNSVKNGKYEIFHSKMNDENFDSSE